MYVQLVHIIYIYNIYRIHLSVLSLHTGRAMYTLFRTTCTYILYIQYIPTLFSKNPTRNSYTQPAPSPGMWPSRTTCTYNIYIQYIRAHLAFRAFPYIGPVRKNLSEQVVRTIGAFCTDVGGTRFHDIRHHFCSVHGRPKIQEFWAIYRNFKTKVICPFKFVTNIESPWPQIFTFYKFF